MGTRCFSTHGNLISGRPGGRKETHESVIVEVILVTDSLLGADEALFVLLATMLVQAVRVVEPALAEAAHRVLLLEMMIQLGPLAAPLLLMSTAAVVVRVRHGKQLVFVGKDFLVGAAQVAQGAVVRRPDVTFQVGPPGEDVLARFGGVVRRCRVGVRESRFIGAVEAQEGEGVVELGAGLEQDAELTEGGQRDQRASRWLARSLEDGHTLVSLKGVSSGLKSSNGLSSDPVKTTVGHSV